MYNAWRYFVVVIIIIFINIYFLLGIVMVLAHSPIYM